MLNYEISIRMWNQKLEFKGMILKVGDNNLTTTHRDTKGFVKGIPYTSS